MEKVKKDCSILEYAFNKNRIIPERLYIKDYATLVEFINDFNELIKSGLIPKEISTEDIEVIDYLDSLGLNIEGYLLDDGLNRDRSYIDYDKYQHIRLFLPFNYVMWNIPSKKDFWVYGSVFQSGSAILGARYANEGEKVSQAALVESQRVSSLIATIPNLSDLEKTLIVSNYLQRYTQYVDGNVTKTVDGRIFSNELGEEELQQLGYVESVLLKGYGLCVAIASASVLLLNNPILKVDVRRAGNLEHAWNYVKIAGKGYYMDNSRSITRSYTNYDYFLKNRCWEKRYFLVGRSRTIARDYANTYESYDISNIDYLRSLGVDFEYPEEPSIKMAS